MIPVEKSKHFYVEAKREIYDMLGEHQMVHLSNNLQIPNLLRINDLKMQVWMIIITGQRTKISRFVQWMTKGQFQLHVFKSPLVIRKSNEEIMLEINTSWILNENIFEDQIYFGIRLKIPKYQLMGIRDFANGKVFLEKSVTKKGNGSV